MASIRYLSEMRACLCIPITDPRSRRIFVGLLVAIERAFATSPPLRVGDFEQSAGRVHLRRLRLGKPNKTKVDA